MPPASPSGRTPPGTQTSMTMEKCTAVGTQTLNRGSGQPVRCFPIALESAHQVCKNRYRNIGIVHRRLLIVRHHSIHLRLAVIVGWPRFAPVHEGKPTRDCCTLFQGTPRQEAHDPPRVNFRSGLLPTKLRPNLPTNPSYARSLDSRDAWVSNSSPT